jgi:diaminohydroxyphosphoribosylaminopyrimidine deaminase/5-amino-6-(5-phosphoribosylamino)uracil reductase
MEHLKDEFYMRRALELATNGRGHVSPNPLVGCVIVDGDEIIGEGWHQKYGEAHAEVNAIRSVEDHNRLSSSTLYVNLEPCAHFGKTPPCADLVIAKKLKRVVVANLDSNPLVAGNGIKKLRAAGIDVRTGVLDREGRELNKRFFTFFEKQRPYIILKWAQTSDGFVARDNYDSKWISNDLSRQLVHKWRSEEDAIMVGTRTITHDNPQLNVRDWTGRDPIRIVIDRFLRLDTRLQVFDRTQQTICYNVLKHEEHPGLVLVQIDEENFIKDLVHDLWKRRIQSVIIEGGATLLNLFIEKKLWDEVRKFESPRRFGSGIPAPRFPGQLHSRDAIQDDWLSIYFPASKTSL